MRQQTEDKPRTVQVKTQSGTPTRRTYYSMSTSPADRHFGLTFKLLNRGFKGAGQLSSIDITVKHGLAILCPYLKWHLQALPLVLHSPSPCAESQANGLQVAHFQRSSANCSANAALKGA
jgi:hypothetical protein